METKICEKCGQTFVPKRKDQRCCNKLITTYCAVCGKEFQVKCSFNNPAQTCGNPECVKQLSNMNRSQTAMQSERICKLCGKPFHPKNVNQVYCDNQHFASCKYCGNLFLVDDPSNIPKTCSEECRYKLAKQNTDLEASLHKMQETMMAKYGVDNAMKLSSTKDKIKTTNTHRYGAEYYTQTIQYKDQLKRTSQMKYGVDHPLQSNEVIDKRNQTVQETYGVDNVAKSSEVKQRIKNTIQQKYGVDNISQSSEIRDKIQKHNLEKYGVSHPMMLPEFQAKAAATNEVRYGRKAYTQQHITNIENWYRFVDNPQEYVSTIYQYRPTSRQLAEDLGVDVSTVDVYLCKNDAYGCIRRAKSLMEEEITNQIHTWLPDCEIINNIRSVIDGLELDIYLPEYKLAIECNPTCTHNSSTSDPWGGPPKSHSYHKRKSDLCEEKGIFLYHVFGYDWTAHKDVVLSMLGNLLHVNQNKVYARKCTLREVSPADAINFLNQNHRQGAANSKIRLGLYYQDELVSLMTFSKMRNSIGTGHEDLSECWELVRFCSKLSTTVVGGANKLFQHFINLMNPEQVRSFSDRAHTKGTLYEKLGFHEVRRSTAGYVWVNVASDVAYNRVNAQKKNIRRFLHDETLDIANKSEKEIMESHGYVRVYDSGTITWEWRT